MNDEPIEIWVQQPDIDAGNREYIALHPISFAVKRMFPCAIRVETLNFTVRVMYGHLAREFAIPDIAMDFMVHYVNGMPAEPFEFTLGEEVNRYRRIDRKWTPVKKPRGWNSVGTAIEQYIKSNTDDVTEAVHRTWAEQFAEEIA